MGPREWCRGNASAAGERDGAGDSEGDMGARAGHRARDQRAAAPLGTALGVYHRTDASAAAGSEGVRRQQQDSLGPLVSGSGHYRQVATPMALVLVSTFMRRHPVYQGH